MDIVFIRILLRIAPLCYMVLIWLQSSYFNPEAIAELSYKINRGVLLLLGVSLELAHFFEFGLLYLLIFLASLSFGKVGKWKNRLAVTIALLYSLLDEVHQIFVPFRSFSLDDILKDAIGIFCVWWIISKNYFSKKDTWIGELLNKVSQLSKKDKTGVPL